MDPQRTHSSFQHQQSQYSPEMSSHPESSDEEDDHPTAATMAATQYFSPGVVPPLSATFHQTAYFQISGPGPHYVAQAQLYAHPQPPADASQPHPSVYSPTSPSQAPTSVYPCVSASSVQGAWNHVPPGSSQSMHPQYYHPTSPSPHPSRPSLSTARTASDRQSRQEPTHTQCLKNLLQRNHRADYHYDERKWMEQGIQWHQATFVFAGERIATSNAHPKASHARREAAFHAYPRVNNILGGR